MTTRSGNKIDSTWIFFVTILTNKGEIKKYLGKNA